MLGIEMHLGRVLVGRTPRRVHHHSDFVVRTSVDRVVQSQHRCAQGTTTMPGMPPGRRGRSFLAGIVGGLEPLEPLLVGPVLGIRGRTWSCRRCRRRLLHPTHRSVGSLYSCPSCRTTVIRRAHDAAR